MTPERAEVDACPVHRSDESDVPPYVSYTYPDVLHALQQPRTDSPREMTFLLVGHVKELLFRAVLVELDQARAQMGRDDVGGACTSLARAVRTQRVLTATWELLTGMSPDEFLEFRDTLGEASGIQSFMYRALEFCLGNKDPRAVAACGPYLERFPILARELRSPSVYDAALGLLSRLGADLPRPVLDRPPAEPHTADPAVEDAWLSVYREPSRWPQAHRVAENLMEVAYQFSQWRATHALVVERMLGSKAGTGGTTGLDWLRSVNEHRFFPELWSARTRL